MEFGSGMINLPSTRFQIGQEPNQRTDGLTILVALEYVKLLEDTLGKTLFTRLTDTFLGPIIKASSRTDGGAQKRGGLGFSGQIVHFLLSRQIMTARSNELWFHMAGQPMRFSLREFYLATGLPCRDSDSDPSQEAEADLDPSQEAEADSDPSEVRFAWPLIETSKSHTLEDLFTQIKSLPEDDENAEEGKLRLSVLLLVESIFLMGNSRKKQKFPLEYVKVAKSNIYSYAWGKKAFNLLIKSLQAVKDESLKDSNQKYTVKGFPMALHWWFLSSVPKLERRYADYKKLDGFLCEKYLKTKILTFNQILEFENSGHLEVVCVVRSDGVSNIPELTTEDEDEYSDSLDSVLELVCKGYRLTRSDWDSKFIDSDKANEVISQQNLRFGPIEDEGDARILRLEEESKTVKAQVSEILEESKTVKAQVSEILVELGRSKEENRMLRENVSEILVELERSKEESRLLREKMSEILVGLDRSKEESKMLREKVSKLEEERGSYQTCLAEESSGKEKQAPVESLDAAVIGERKKGILKKPGEGSKKELRVQFADMGQKKRKPEIAAPVVQKKRKQEVHPTARRSSRLDM